MPEFDYTQEELQYFEKELRKYKLPWISKMFKKYGIQVIRYSILPMLILLTIFGVIYNGSAQGVNEWMWVFDKAVALSYIFGFGLFAVVSKLSEQYTANKLRKKLGLSHHYFKLLVAAHQITGM